MFVLTSVNILMFSVCFIYGFPFNEFGIDEDAILQESLTRNVRETPENPQPVQAEPVPGTKAYLHTYSDGADGENEQGYYRRKSDQGNDGYKHYDSFHKKNADKYAFEAHSAFGKYAGQDHGASGTKHNKRSLDAEAYTQHKKANKEANVEADVDTDDGYFIEGGEHYTEGGEEGEERGAYVGDVDVESEAGNASPESADLD